MKYVFEKYEFGKRGRVFLGYESVEAQDPYEAKDVLQIKVGEDVVLAQIYIPIKQ